jgi:hypothetical protein
VVKTAEDETQGRKRHDEGDAYSRLGAGDPDLGLDKMSVIVSLGRLADKLTDFGAMIVQRVRERVVKRGR